MYTATREEEIILLKKLWHGVAVVCPKCGKARLEPHKKLFGTSKTDWKCPSCKEVYRTVKMAKELPEETEDV